MLISGFGVEWEAAEVKYMEFADGLSVPVTIMDAG